MSLVEGYFLLNRSQLYCVRNEPLILLQPTTCNIYICVADGTKGNTPFETNYFFSVKAMPKVQIFNRQLSKINIEDNDHYSNKKEKWSFWASFVQ